MLKAKVDKIGKTYTKHVYIFDSIKEDRELETPVLRSTLGDDPEEIYIVDTNDKEAYIINSKGYKIYSGYKSIEVLRYFNML